MSTTDLKYHDEYEYERENRRISLIITTTIMVALLLLLYFLNQGESGGGGGGGNGEVGIMFGAIDAGTGEVVAMDMSPTVAANAAIPPPESQPATAPLTADNNDVVTQSHEEAPVIAEPNKPKPTTTPPVKPVETPKPTPTPTKPVETPKPTPKPVETPKPAPPIPAEPTVIPGSTFPKGGGKGTGGGAGNQGSPSGTGTGTSGTGGGDGGNGPGSGGGSGSGNGTGSGIGDGPGSGPGSGGGSGGGTGYSLGNRKPTKQIAPVSDQNKFGTVRIKIFVNSQGKVINAVYSASGSTTTDSYLVAKAKEAAMKWEWSPDPNNNPEQIGYIDFVYKQK